MKIFLLFGSTDGPTLVETILMAANTMQGIRDVVQEKTLVGTDPERSDTQRLGHRVRDLLPVTDHDRHCIQIWIESPVPQMGFGNLRSEERRVGKECRSRWP